MITAFTVKNFKAIGEEPVRIELKPITLLFGANSAGKSSIIHALHYAYEIFNNRNLDPKNSTLGSSNLDLGGFQRFVHKNDLSRIITIRLEFETDYESLQEICDSLFSVNGKGIIQYFSRTSFNLFGVVNSYVEIGIAWNEMNKKPYAKYYETGFNNEKMATIDFDAIREEAILCYLNIDNPFFCDVWVDDGVTIGSIVENTINPDFYKTCLDYNEEINKINELINYEENKIKEKLIKNELKSEDHDEDFADNQSNEIKKYMRLIRKNLFQKYGKIPPCTSILASGEDNFSITLLQRDALPYWNEPLRVGGVWKEYSEEGDVIVLGDIPFIIPNNRRVFLNLLTAILTQPGQYISKMFTMRYVGPLREIPPRDFSGIDPSQESNSWRWATGLAAWDFIYWIGQQKLDKLGYLVSWSSSSKIQHTKQKYNIKDSAIQELEIINNWLERLNTGYQILIETYREISSDHPFLEIENVDPISLDIYQLIKDIKKLPEKIRIWLQDDDHNKLTPHEIGVGISQILPVVIATVVRRNWIATFVAIEQPELHIHPAIQVQLADLFISHAINKNNNVTGKKIIGAKNIINEFLQHRKNFLIETHSEHLLLRLLRRINETFEGELPNDVEPCTAEDVVIYYLEKKSHRLCVRRLEINEDGTSQGEWPQGFFEERIMELF